MMVQSQNCETILPYKCLYNLTYDTNQLVNDPINVFQKKKLFWSTSALIDLKKFHFPT